MCGSPAHPVIKNRKLGVMSYWILNIIYIYIERERGGEGGGARVIIVIVVRTGQMAPWVELFAFHIALIFLAKV